MTSPPPIRRSPSSPSAERWNAMLADLMKAPGQWVIIRNGIGKSTAASMAQDIRKLAYVALREFNAKYGGELDAVIRREYVDPKERDYAVWAIWDPKRVPMDIPASPESGVSK